MLNTGGRSPLKPDSDLAADETEGSPPQFEAVHDPRYCPPRQFINPIQGLTPARAITLIVQGQYGYQADLQWTYAAIERKGPVLRALKERRLSAIKRLKWTIRVKDQARDVEDDDVKAEVEAQTQELQNVYNGIKNLKAAIAHLALATFRGFSMLEKHVDEDGLLTALQPVPQWYWCFTYPVREWLYNYEALQTNAGAPVDPDAFVIREVDDPLDEIAIIIFLRKNLSKKDWDLFVETYGVPSLFAEFDGNQPRTSDLTAAVQQINKVIANGRGALPPGVKITSTDRVIGTNHPFKEHLDYQNFELVLAGTGGKLTMLSDATGIGQGASHAHEQVFQDIAEAEGEDICEVLRAQIDEPELKRRGFEHPLVEFALEVMKPDERQKNAEILGAIAAAGYRTSDEQAAEMLEMDVHSVMGGMPEGGGEEGGGEPEEAQDWPLGINTAPASAEPPPFRRAAPFYDAAHAHDSWKQPRPAQPAPFWPADSAASSVSNPDPPMMLTTYPSGQRLSQYMKMMRAAIEGYKKAFARGVSRDLGPVRDIVRSLLEVDNDEELKNRLQHLEGQLPEHLRRMMVNSDAVKAMEKALTESIEQGAKNPMVTA